MHVVFGYIDASSGSMILQAIIGGSMAAIYGGRKFIGMGFQSIRSKFSRSSTQSTESTSKDIKS